MIASLRALERFLLPNACVACGRAISPATRDALVCSVCRARLRPLGPGCTRCRQPLPPVGPCRLCADWPAALTWVRSSVWLGDEAREMIHHAKYEGYHALGGAMAEVIARTVPRPAHGCLVPVPLARARLRRRGYNQAAAIAEALGARWRLPLVDGLIARTRETRSQTALTPEARTANMRGAFVATPAGRDAAVTAASRHGVPVILVDDVLTTGATLAAAAAALAAGGQREIAAVTFARAVPYARAGADE